LKDGTKGKYISLQLISIQTIQTDMQAMTGAQNKREELQHGTLLSCK